MREGRWNGEPVRQHTPQRLRAEGYRCEVRQLDDAAFARALRSRMQDELRGYLSRPTLESLAELAELIEALAGAGHGEEPASLEQTRAQLTAREGDYRARLVLLSCQAPPSGREGLDYDAEDAVVVDEDVEDDLRPQLPPQA